jgi:hypothetical protein
MLVKLRIFTNQPLDIMNQTNLVKSSFIYY